MNLLWLWAAIVLVVYPTTAAPQFGGIANAAKSVVQAAAKLLRFENVNNGAEGYNFMYELDDGTVRQEKGEFVNGVWTVTGMVSYLNDDKTMRHTETFVADDKGYQPVVKDEPAERLSPGTLASLTG